MTCTGSVAETVDENIYKYILYIIYIYYIFIYIYTYFQRGHIWDRPPSIGRDTPVVKDESSEARKAMALATSPTVPGLPSA